MGKQVGSPIPPNKSEFKNLCPGDDVEVFDYPAMKVFKGRVHSVLSTQFTYVPHMAEDTWSGIRYCSARGEWKKMGTRTLNKYKCTLSDCAQVFLAPPGPVECPNCSNHYVEPLGKITLGEGNKVILEETEWGK